MGAALEGLTWQHNAAGREWRGRFPRSEVMVTAFWSAAGKREERHFADTLIAPPQCDVSSEIISQED